MNIEIIEISCPTCFVPFYLTASHKARLMESKEKFWCPSGHGQNYTGETAEQKLARITREKNESILMLSNELEGEKKKVRKLKKATKK